ncbi:hypothetical protein [Blastopirellula marina]|uniref:Uncharacterized protein n=1 Tax=Blastopirellula marina DSM 3645 TaxID=314230 RepID=A3ZQ70_9BACT|nr:hypothetical protein [Blastopirellula marina]EAQ81343.1 hypothetical protein DSM3645_23166 [Blastopirellula marina DSM 3645]
MKSFRLMALLNVLVGIGRAMIGYAAITGGGAYYGQGINSPQMYIASGVISIVLGIGNWLKWQLATVGSILMIALSIYDSQYGDANQDWRFWALVVYATILTVLVLWSYFDTAKEMKAKNS